LLCFASNLTSLSRDVRPGLKRRHHSKTWARLMETSPKAILITSYVSVQVFPRFWQNLMHNSECDATTTQTLVLSLGLRENARRRQVRTGRDMPEHAFKVPRPWMPVHIGDIVPVWILSEQPSYILHHISNKGEWECLKM
jgi:hypothetical protein